MQIIGEGFDAARSSCLLYNVAHPPTLPRLHLQTDWLSIHKLHAYYSNNWRKKYIELVVPREKIFLAICWLYVGYTLSLFWRKNLCLAKNFILKVWPAGYNIIWKYLCVVFCARSTNTSCPNKEWAIPITCHVCGSDLISISGLSIAWPSFRTRFVSKRFSAAF